MSKKKALLTSMLVLGTVIVVGISFGIASLTFAQDESATSSRRTLSVSGQGSVSAIPDVLQARIGVETKNANLSEALAENNLRMENVLALLNTLGIDPKDVQTVDFFINETYDRDGNLSGFSVFNNVLVTIRDMDLAGVVLDQVVQAGANRISGIQLAISETSELLTQARKLAVENARAKAKELADAAGMFLGNPITINESGGFQPVINARVAALEMDAAVPLAAGEQSVTINVSITYEMF